jgi:hypothetical protein
MEILFSEGIDVPEIRRIIEKTENGFQPLMLYIDFLIVSELIFLKNMKFIPVRKLSNVVIN